MKTNEFYQIQADAFRDYAKRIPDRDLFPLFNVWAESKFIDGIDKLEIWEIVVKTGQKL